MIDVRKVALDLAHMIIISEANLSSKDFLIKVSEDIELFMEKVTNIAWLDEEDEEDVESHDDGEGSTSSPAGARSVSPRQNA